MRKAFMGARLLRLREEQGITQAKLAQLLDLSPSYLNQIERNQRPLTVQVLLRLNKVFGVDVQMFSEDEEVRLISDLRDILGETQTDTPISLAEIKDLVANMPHIGRALVNLSRRAHASEERLTAFANSLNSPLEDLMPPAPLMPYEEVRDFFYARHNHVAELDELAEKFCDHHHLTPGKMESGLERIFRDHYDMRVILDHPDQIGGQRAFHPNDKKILLSQSLTSGQRAFQLATQLAFLTLPKMLDQLVTSPRLTSAESRHLARIGLANYYAGALILPYQAFLESAENLRYDIDLLGEKFGVGFETICHRLSTLQRPGAQGVSFFFVRVDQAGNISKRQSATDFHFSRVGGSCPLWNVYDAFTTPGRILTQMAQMPDGRTYLWMARTVTSGYRGYGAPGKKFAIGLGCDLRHADKLVYSQGLNLQDPASATPIGAGCKICERPDCTQRAFPAIGRKVQIDETRSQFEPYSAR